MIIAVLFALWQIFGALLTFIFSLIFSLLIQPLWALLMLIAMFVAETYSKIAQVFQERGIVVGLLALAVIFSPVIVPIAINILKKPLQR